MDIKKIQHILGQLAEVNEQLMSLADDIWLGIHPRDNESITTGAQFLQDLSLVSSYVLLVIVTRKTAYQEPNHEP